MALPTWMEDWKYQLISIDFLRTSNLIDSFPHSLLHPVSVCFSLLEDSVGRAPHHGNVILAASTAMSSEFCF